MASESIQNIVKIDEYTLKFVFSSILSLALGSLASMLESIGDYYSLADITCLPLPPRHAVNRGISIEGNNCFYSSSDETKHADWQQIQFINQGICTEAKSPCTAETNCPIIGSFLTFSRKIIQLFRPVYNEHSRIGLCNFRRVRHRKWGNKFQRKYWRYCNYSSRLTNGHASKG